MDFARFEAMTFDCYGTLVDWESGIRDAIQPVLRAHDINVSDDEVLEQYARIEPAVQAISFRPYRDVVRDVMDAFGAAHRFSLDPQERAAIVESLGYWPVFPDTVESLRSLQTRFRLAVVSNIDRDLFKQTNASLQIEFDAIVTAEDIGSYKPARTHFDEVLRRLDLPIERVLHVAQSRFHDIAPASELGFSTVWVNRQGGRHGATSPSDAQPDLEVPDLRTLADLVSRA